MRAARARKTWRSSRVGVSARVKERLICLLNYNGQPLSRPPGGPPRRARSHRHRGAHQRGHLHRPEPVDAGRPRLRRAGARAVAGRRDPHRARRPPRALDARLLPAARATPNQPITFSVDRIHDGRSFSTRRTQAYQDGVPILSMIASFQDSTTRASTTRSTMPDRRCPDPESLPSTAEVLGRHRPPGRAVLGHPARLRHPARRVADLLPVPRRARAAPGGLDEGHRPAARRPQPAPRRTRLRERLLDPRAGAARARHRVDAPRPQGREPRPRHVVAPLRHASTSGCSTCRSRRTRIGGRGLSLGPHLHPRRRAAGRASPRRAWCGCRGARRDRRLRLVSAPARSVWPASTATAGDDARCIRRCERRSPRRASHRAMKPVREQQPHPGSATARRAPAPAPGAGVPSRRTRRTTSTQPPIAARVPAIAKLR